MQTCYYILSKQHCLIIQEIHVHSVPMCRFRSTRHNDLCLYDKFELEDNVLHTWHVHKILSNPSYEGCNVSPLPPPPNNVYIYVLHQP